MCTVVVWGDNGQAVVSSRNMDWFESMDTDLWVVPAGRKEDGAATNDPNPMVWTSAYGSVIASVYNIGSADGLNEKGLGAHLLWLAPSEFGERDPKQTGLAVSLWAQYYLDNFATVADAVADYEKNPYQIISAHIAGRPATVHLQISDSTGDVAVFESIGGKIVIHHGKQYPVLTNQPTFDEQLTNLDNYLPFGGSKPLPGTTAAADRFVRATYYREHLTAPKSTDEAIAGILSVLRNAAQPYGEASSAQPMIAPTIWRATLDHTNQRYFFESTSSPYLVWLDLGALDFTAGAPAKRLDLSQMADKIGQQNDALVDQDLFQFAKAVETAPNATSA